MSPDAAMPAPIMVDDDDEDDDAQDAT